VLPDIFGATVALSLRSSSVDASGKSAHGMTRAGWNFAKKLLVGSPDYPNSKWRPRMAAGEDGGGKVTIPSSPA